MKGKKVFLLVFLISCLLWVKLRVSFGIQNSDVSETFCLEIEGESKRKKKKTKVIRDGRKVPLKSIVPRYLSFPRVLSVGCSPSSRTE